MADTADFVALMGPVAIHLLGDPNPRHSSKTELRWGTNGSLCVDLIKGTWFDHEANEGGGLLDLIRRVKGFHGAIACMDFLDREGFTNGTGPRPRGNGSGAHHQQHEPQRPPPGREVEHYDYIDEAGNVLYQVVRYAEPKTFRQRRPDGNGGWIWNMRGTRQIPFRLADLNEALAQEHTVFICEGEKDVNTMWANGLPATCNAMGAGSWAESLNDYFRDADVVIIADNDPQSRNSKGELLTHPDGRPKRPGQDHAHAIARALSEANIARRVRLLDLGRVWVQCPEKGDISDWFEAGFRTDDLWPIVEQLPGWSPEQAVEIAPLETRDVSDWEGKEPPEREWVIKNRVILRNVTMLGGDGATGKTTIALQMCVCVAGDKPDWLHGLIDRPGPALFITAEEDESEVWRRLKDIVQHYGLSFAELKGKLHIHCLMDDYSYLALPKGRMGELATTPVYERVKVTIERIKPTLVVLESSADLFGGDEINRAQVRMFITFLRRLARIYYCAIVLISHPSQSGIREGTGTSGNTSWNNSVRSRMYFKVAKKHEDNSELDDDTDLRDLEFMKNNYGKKDETVKVVWSRGVYMPIGMFKDVVKQAATKQEVERAFMSCLRYRMDLNLGGVSHLSKSKSRYAPRLFVGMAQAQGYNAKALEAAMMRLIEQKKLIVKILGTASRALEYLAFPEEPTTT